jgi:hypothetical protein
MYYFNIEIYDLDNCVVKDGKGIIYQVNYYILRISYMNKISSIPY